jgi:hypothetical protein
MLLKKKVIYLLQQHDVQHQGLVQKLQLSTSCFIYNANDMYDY